MVIIILSVIKLTSAANKQPILNQKTKNPIVKISKIMEEEKFISEMETSLSHKFAKKPEVITGNMNALRMTLEEIGKLM